MLTPQPHPDEITNYRELKKIRVGAHQGVEDQALKAYHEVYESEGKEAAEAKYFETFKKAYGKVNS
jgi:hypothetical protein